MSCAPINDAIEHSLNRLAVLQGLLIRKTAASRKSGVFFLPMHIPSRPGKHHFIQT
jgi:hypothetical protein